MGVTEAIILGMTALLAGGINAVAGGGSLVTFPALLLFNIPPLTANATATVAAWPGLLSGAWHYRGHLRPYWRPVLALSAVALLGGLAGGTLLLAIPSQAVAHAVPWLMGLGCLMLVLSPQIQKAGRMAREWRPDSIGSVLGWRSAVQFAVGIATGFFSAAGGVLLVASLSSFGLRDMQLMNALKIVLGMAMVTASVGAFIAAGQIAWAQAGIMMGGAMIGGHLGAALAQRLPASALRVAVIIFCVAVTAVVALRQSA
ncbi:sulfite exporter TauE/SafE family protein [Acetobacteraceae bacterium H6797]|nr:sulfite exporter TauE/SafE family protein [Acetobacteraceae bacterium H6797]